MSPHEDEAELIRRARAGEPEAFGFLVDRHLARAFRAALALVGAREPALDLTQDAFLRVFEARVLVSDGVIQAPSPDGEPFGWRRVLDALARHGLLGAEALVAALQGEVRAWTAGRPRGDDLVLVALRRRVD
ncbi:MAG: SpoIIE family protein phosphatase [Planctomycetes bacterium]|nr:SpoIIE family protein phosphatase [Planctomycetota bacterium]